MNENAECGVRRHGAAARVSPRLRLQLAAKALIDESVDSMPGVRPHGRFRK
jgi:hypothetical protein